MSILVSVIATVGGLYFYFDDKKQEKGNKKELV